MSVSAVCYLKIFTAVTRNWHWKCSGCFEYCIAKKLVSLVKVFEWHHSSGTATHRSKQLTPRLIGWCTCFIFGMSGLKIGYPDRFFVLFLSPSEVNAEILLHIRL